MDILTVNVQTVIILLLVMVIVRILLRVCDKNPRQKGRMAGGVVSFKIETLIQLLEGCNTQFVSPVILSHFAKREVKEYPQKLPVYLKNAFLSGAYTLAKG